MQAFEILTKEGRAVELAMQELWLGGEVLPVGARLVARHVFASAEEDPREVIYSFMLPRDAALRQFRIEGDGFSVHSDLQPVNDAERLYEDAMSDGFLTTMTRQYRDGVTSLMVGNLHPGKRVTVYLEIIAGVEAHDDGFRFRFPFTLAPSYHPRASAVRTAPGEGEMELPEETFGGVILPPYRDDPADLHRTGFDLTVKAPGGAASTRPKQAAALFGTIAGRHCSSGSMLRRMGWPTGCCFTPFPMMRNSKEAGHSTTNCFPSFIPSTFRSRDSSGSRKRWRISVNWTVRRSSRGLGGKMADRLISLPATTGCT
jgi:hypothetical protein